MKLKIYGSRALDLYGIRWVPFPLLESV